MVGAHPLLQGIVGTAVHEDMARLRVHHTVVGPAIDNDAHAYAGAHRDIDAGGHVPGAAPDGLPQGGGVHVGIEAHGDAQGLFKALDDGKVPPAQLGGG